jgi:predicted metal-binding membrane protein
MAAPAGSGSGGSIRLGPLARADIVLLVVVALATVAAWIVTIRQAQTMPMTMPAAAPPAMTPAAMSGMSGMSDSGAGMAPAAAAMAAPPAAGWLAAVAFVVAWAVMMAAMMLPAAAPTIALYRRFAAGSTGRAGAATAIFAASYLLVWAAVGIPVWAAIQFLTPRLPAAGEGWERAALGGTLILAGLYQLSPLKRVCLRHCQSPLGFLLIHWRGGPSGAIRMGLRHAGYCLGCCWALFAILVAAGVMSLPWMLLLTLLIVAEKTLPVGGRVATISGVALAALGALVAVGALPMPWRM